MDWYYAHNGEQKGPVSEEVLRGLVTSGQITSDDLVWKEGMADWASYQSVLGGRMLAAKPASAAPAVALPSGSGTGGRTSNVELRAQARRTLAGKWGPAVGITLIWIVIQQVMGFIPILGLIAVLCCTGPLMLGYHEYFLRLVRGAEPLVGNLFSGFSNFVLGLGLYVLVSLIVLFASLVAAIPGGILMGVVASQGTPENNPLFWVGLALVILPVTALSVYLYLRYSLVYFIGVDEPEKGVMHALKKSPQMLKGNMGKLFWMFLVFFGWGLLTIFTLFIGMLWVAPYMYASMAGFYDDLQGDVAAAAVEPVG